MKSLKDKMYNYEITPPSESWQIIAGAEKSAFTLPTVIILGLIIVSEQPFELNTIRPTV